MFHNGKFEILRATRSVDTVFAKKRRNEFLISNYREKEYFSSNLVKSTAHILPSLTF